MTTEIARRSSFAASSLRMNPSAPARMASRATDSLLLPVSTIILILGQAARISGMTPAAISLLLVHLKKRQRRIA